MTAEECYPGLCQRGGCFLSQARECVRVEGSGVFWVQGFKVLGFRVLGGLGFRGSSWFGGSRVWGVIRVWGV